jgi:hypothetical protein
LTDTQAPPEILGDAGRALWNRVTDGGAITLEDPAEAEALRKACELEDTAARLAEAVDALPSLMVEGSRGQLVLSPLVSELRLTRDNIARLVGRIVVDDDSGTMSRSASARKAARARWHGAA